MSFWTDERLQVVRDLAPTHSSTAIGVRIGCSRNAVIGKAQRENISISKRDGGAPARPIAPPVVIAAPAVPDPPKAAVIEAPKAVAKPAPAPKTLPAPVKPAPPPKIVCEPATVLSTPKTIIELGNLDCKWPLGDPASPDFRYCGSPKASKNYCAGHAKLARPQ